MNKVNDSSDDQCFQGTKGIFYSVNLMKKVIYAGLSS